MVPNPVEFFRKALVGLAFALLLPAVAHAAPRSIADCEAIKDADSYNQCLASFGPVAPVGAPAIRAPAEAPATTGAAEPRRASKHAATGAAESRHASAHARHGGRGRHAHVSSGRHRGAVKVTRSKNGRVRTVIKLKRR